MFEEIALSRLACIYTLGMFRKNAANGVKSNFCSFVSECFWHQSWTIFHHESLCPYFQNKTMFHGVGFRQFCACHCIIILWWLMADKGFSGEWELVPKASHWREIQNSSLVHCTACICQLTSKRCVWFGCELVRHLSISDMIILLRTMKNIILVKHFSQNQQNILSSFVCANLQALWNRGIIFCTGLLDQSWSLIWLLSWYFEQRSLFYSS